MSDAGAALKYDGSWPGRGLSRCRVGNGQCQGGVVAGVNLGVALCPDGVGGTHAVGFVLVAGVS